MRAYTAALGFVKHMPETYPHTICVGTHGFIFRDNAAELRMEIMRLGGTL